MRYMFQWMSSGLRWWNIFTVIDSRFWLWNYVVVCGSQRSMKNGDLFWYFNFYSMTGFIAKAYQVGFFFSIRQKSVRNLLEKFIHFITWGDNHLWFWSFGYRAFQPLKLFSFHVSYESCIRFGKKKCRQICDFDKSLCLNGRNDEAKKNSHFLQIMFNCVLKCIHNDDGMSIRCRKSR